MIKLEDAKITDVLPSVLASQPWVQALSYVVSSLLRQAINYSARIRIWKNLDALPDALLDEIASEIRTPNYDQTFSKAVKRQLIRETMQYFERLGTNSAITSILASIFGDAEIEDWYDYDGEPGYFRILTTNPAITGDTLTRFEAAAENTKRLSAWLDNVVVDGSVPDSTLYVGFALGDYGEDIFKEGEL